MNFIFNEKEPTQLCEIMGRNQSDKGSLDITNWHHNYTTFYYSIFKDIKEKQLRIFELGLGTNNVTIPSNMGVNGRPGASLYGWVEFFTNSAIFGADIDKDILFNNSKIKTFYCDQTNPDVIKNMWNNNELYEDFDIIIDDGLHRCYANVCFFENSIHKLKPNGFFIIEDIHIKEKHLFEYKINEWKQIFNNLVFNFISVPSTVNNYDNNLLVIYKNNL
jgi:SAM-dependent methyltransferase